MTEKNIFSKLIWRLQFKKVPFIKSSFDDARCINCDGGKPIIECGEYYCPCSMEEQLKRVRTFKFLK